MGYKEIYYSKESLLRFRKGDHNTISDLYDLAYPICANFIKKNNGSKEDAEDIFQESLIVFYRNLMKDSFELSCHVKTYLFSIVRNLWLKQLKKKGKTILVDDATIEYISLSTDNDITDTLEEKHIRIGKILSDFKEDCKKLLKAFYYQNASLKEIAEDMGYTYHFVRIKKVRCMEALKKKAKEVLVIE